jgi:hypothetical protein
MTVEIPTSGKGREKWGTRPWELHKIMTGVVPE